MRLESGPWRAELLPERGAHFAGLSHAGRALLDPAHGAFWMLPWTNRIDGGCFPWAGKTYHFPITHPDEGNALHGLSRALPWQVEAASAERAVLTQALAQAPFDYAARLEVTLSEAGLALDLTLRNQGAGPCPMGFGWHPWFARPAGCTVRFASEATFRRNARKLPVEAIPSLGLDGGEADWLGTDGHFAGWDGMAELHRPDLTLVLRASGDWSRNLQFFAPADRPVICLEPVSHVPDVINRPQLAPWGAMHVLAPGEALRGGITLSVTGPN
ncbi:MAG TPA: aldose epimerase [Roseomonas sp.]|nr:aldose epimerase [Roseomonas sp.]